jgi:hypothetical protein
MKRETSKGKNPLEQWKEKRKTYASSVRPDEPIKDYS